MPRMPTAAVGRRRDGPAPATARHRRGAAMTSGRAVRPRRTAGRARPDRPSPATPSRRPRCRAIAVAGRRRAGPRWPGRPHRHLADPGRAPSARRHPDEAGGHGAVGQGDQERPVADGSVGERASSDDAVGRDLDRAPAQARRPRTRRPPRPPRAGRPRPTPRPGGRAGVRLPSVTGQRAAVRRLRRAPAARVSEHAEPRATAGPGRRRGAATAGRRHPPGGRWCGRWRGGPGRRRRR